ncbi:MAG: hypothetical protein J0L69_09935 [Bacteroidetes bacterium]|nr:hypothetical protein [Bacteroidota bacterium]
MVKIERGIIVAEIDTDDVYVHGVGKIFKLNIGSMFEREYKNKEQVLGVEIDKKFTLCHEFELNDDKKLFGYIINNGFGSTAIRVQTIKDFDKNTHYPFNHDKDYSLGEELVIKKESIVNFTD